MDTITYVTDQSLQEIPILYETGTQTISGLKDFLISPTVSGVNVLLSGDAYPNNNPSGFLMAVNTTYSELTGLKNIAGLVPGQYYRISDFRLMWYNQSINDTGVKSGIAPEPLSVLAISNNKIFHEARSEFYPQDTIYYDIDASGSYTWGTLNNNVAIPNFKGWIYRRIDHKLNIDIGWDWRNITVNCCRPVMTGIPIYTGTTIYNQFSVVRGFSILTTGKLYYSLVNSNSGNNLANSNYWLPVSHFTEGNTYFSTNENFGFIAYNKNGIFVELPADPSKRIQQPTFTSSLTAQGVSSLINCKNIKIQDGYSNVIFGNGFSSNIIGNRFDSNTIGNSFNSNVIGNGFNFNTVGDIFTSNAIGDNFNSNVTRSNFNYNSIGDNFYYNTIGTSFYSHTIGNNFGSNTVGSFFYSNIIGNSFNTNTIGNNFNYNSIGDYFNSNTIGNNSYFNTIGNSFGSNTIGDNFHSNMIENNFYGNSIGNGLDSNTIGNSFNSNTIGNSFNSNTIENSFESNTIGNGFDSNAIGNSFNSNIIGMDFTSNTIENSFNSNTIGNSFRMNTSENNISIGDVTGATHIYNLYNTRIFKNSDQTVRLSYFNGSDQLVVTDINA